MSWMVRRGCKHAWLARQAVFQTLPNWDHGIFCDSRGLVVGRLDSLPKAAETPPTPLWDLASFPAALQ